MAGIREDGDETMSVAEPHLSVPPPRSSFETFLSDFLLSPGPMTLMSNFLSDPESRSFCQLLAGVSPSSPISGAILPTTTNTSIDSSDETKPGDEEVGKDIGSGYKQNRPQNLVVDDDSSFLFTVPPGLSPSWLLNSPAWCQSPFGMSHRQALAHVSAQAALSPSYFSIPAEFRTSLSGSVEISEQQSIHSGMSDQEDSHLESNQSSELSLPEKKPLASSLSLDKPANDGYNWRKYGQKQVKASECPRSYYRCSNINCFVKKQVGHSLDGKVSEIVYKGEHNHEPPQLNKRGKEGADMSDIQNFLAWPELDLQPLPDTDGFEEFVPSQLLARDNQVSTQVIHLEESKDAKIRLHDGGHDEPFPKRRMAEVRTSSEPTTSINTVTESRIIVQTRSEVDQLDDGYKWRKYGQKVVKGNTYPRSYYKCTYSGCKVRKQIERASADPKAVVTTYEGKHSHDIPLGRKRSKSGSGFQAKPAEHEETNSLRDQTPIFLRLKEEQIKA